MRLLFQVTAQRLFEIETKRSLFMKREYLSLRGSEASVVLMSGTDTLATLTFKGKLGEFNRTSPYAQKVIVTLPQTSQAGLSIFAQCPGIFTYRVDLLNVDTPPEPTL